MRKRCECVILSTPLAARRARKWKGRHTPVVRTVARRPDSVASATAPTTPFASSPSRGAPLSAAAPLSAPRGCVVVVVSAPPCAAPLAALPRGDALAGLAPAGSSTASLKLTPGTGGVGGETATGSGEVARWPPGVPLAAPREDIAPMQQRRGAGARRREGCHVRSRMSALTHRSDDGQSSTGVGALHGQALLAV